MKNDNYNNIFENMGKFVLKVSEGVAKMVEGIICIKRWHNM